MRWCWYLLIIYLNIIIIIHAESDDDSDEYEEDFSKVTCGSVIKLQHVNSKYRLHSHEIKWGSGSGQQSVTAMKDGSDANSYWTVKAKYGDTCKLGTPINCGDTIRLLHLKTNKYLHSHLHKSPLSGRQEISGYGSKSTSDTGDNWLVECSTDQWKWGEKVMLKHVDTQKYLFTNKGSKFDNRNCRGCPIIGQLEVSGSTIYTYNSDAYWRAKEGFYFPVL